MSEIITLVAVGLIVTLIAILIIKFQKGFEIIEDKSPMIIIIFACLVICGLLYMDPIVIEFTPKYYDDFAIVNDYKTMNTWR